MSDKYTTLGDLREAISEYDDNTRIKLDAAGSLLSTVAVKDEDGTLVFY